MSDDTTTKADLWTCTKCGHYMDGPTTTANPRPCPYCTLRTSHAALLTALKEMSIEFGLIHTYGVKSHVCNRKEQVEEAARIAITAGEEVANG